MRANKALDSDALSAELTFQVHSHKPLGVSVGIGGLIPPTNQAAAWSTCTYSCPRRLHCNILTRGGSVDAQSGRSRPGRPHQSLCTPWNLTDSDSTKAKNLPAAYHPLTLLSWKISWTTVGQSKHFSKKHVEWGISKSITENWSVTPQQTETVDSEGYSW